MISTSRARQLLEEWRTSALASRIVIEAFSTSFSSANERSFGRRLFLQVLEFNFPHLGVSRMFQPRRKGEMGAGPASKRLTASADIVGIVGDSARRRGRP